MATKKRASSKDKGQAKIGKVMHEYKVGELKSSSGEKVTNPKQAVAIALSEARASAKKVTKKAAVKKSPR